MYSSSVMLEIPAKFGPIIIRIDPLDTSKWAFNGVGVSCAGPFILDTLPCVEKSRGCPSFDLTDILAPEIALVQVTFV